MLELVENLIFAIVMVPLVMAAILGLIYVIGGLFNVISGVKDSNHSA